MAAATPIAQSPEFQKALTEFQALLSQDDNNEIQLTTLENLQQEILDIQKEHTSARKNRNMARLKRFLEGMEEYAKIIEVFLNASSVVCFIWVGAALLYKTGNRASSSFRALSS